MMGKLPEGDVLQREVPDNLDWDDFRVLLEVVRAGSFNRGAARLKMTQPTVSRRLMRLEAAVGVKIFDRDRRGPRLTPEGHRICSEANVAQAALARALNRRGTSARVVGECNLIMSDGIASYWMTRFVATFFRRFPNIELKLFAARDTAAEKRDVHDLHVHYHESSEPDSITVRLGMVHFVPFASNDYLRRHGVPHSAGDLKNHKLLDRAVYLSDIGPWSSWAPEGETSRTMLLTNLSATLAESVRNGAGIALLPTYAHAIEPIAFVPLDIGVRLQAPLYVSHPRDASRKWPVRATMDFLCSCVFDPKNMPWFRDAFVRPVLEWSQRLDTIQNGHDGMGPPEVMGGL